MRARAKRRRALQLRVALVVAVVAALVAGWALLSNSQVFEIKTVEVRGTQRMTREEVIAAAGIGQRETLLRLDEDAIRAALLAKPWIEDVSLGRRIPSTLRINVTERTPVVVVDTGAEFWFVGADGTQIATGTAEAVGTVPMVRDLPDFAPEAGRVSDSSALANVLAVLRGLPDSLVSTVRSVSAAGVEETGLVTADGVEIMIGEATQLAEKSEIVARILDERRGDVVLIDVRSVEHPISRGLND